MTKSEIVEILERRLHGGVGQSREWARFVDVPFKDAEIEAIRQRSVDFDLVLTDEKRLALQELIREIRDQVPRGRQ
jgi:hypothetical protein